MARMAAFLSLLVRLRHAPTNSSVNSLPPALYLTQRSSSSAMLARTLCLKSDVRFSEMPEVAAGPCTAADLAPTLFAFVVAPTIADRPYAAAPAVAEKSSNGLCCLSPHGGTLPSGMPPQIVVLSSLCFLSPSPLSRPSALDFPLPADDDQGRDFPSPEDFRIREEDAHFACAAFTTLSRKTSPPCRTFSHSATKLSAVTETRSSGFIRPLSVKNWVYLAISSGD